jgi:hypothetical protein
MTKPTSEGCPHYDRVNVRCQFKLVRFKLHCSYAIAFLIRHTVPLGTSPRSSMRNNITMNAIYNVVPSQGLTHKMLIFSKSSRRPRCPFGFGICLCGLNPGERWLALWSDTLRFKLGASIDFCVRCEAEDKSSCWR